MFGPDFYPTPRTIADLQGQVEVAQKQLKFLGATMQPDGMVSLDLKKYHAAHRCKAHREDPWQDIDTEIDCFVCLKQRVAQLEQDSKKASTDYEACRNALDKTVGELTTLQADHARVLGLVQAYAKAKTEFDDNRLKEDHHEWKERFNRLVEAETALIAASLPAQPAQGGA